MRKRPDDHEDDTVGWAGDTTDKPDDAEELGEEPDNPDDWADFIDDEIEPEEDEE